MWQRFARALPYHAYFLRHSGHAWLALVTLGVGIAVATPLGLAAGLGAYGLGVIFLPEVGPFKRRYDTLRQAEMQARVDAETSAKESTRLALIKRLSPKAKARREDFANLCQELRAKLGEAEASALMQEDSFAKIEDSHLLLLAMDADIHEYLANAEAPEELQAKMKTLESELETLKAKERLSEVQHRLVLSKEETLKNLQQQSELQERMKLNLELAQSELDRLESQLSSLKAELISQPASQLSNRLGETLIQVEASQRVLKEGGIVATPDLTTLLGEKA